jgi:hypothetical protein
MDFNVDIIDYLGKFDNAIFVKLSLSDGQSFYDAVFYYKAELITLTVEERLENKLGSQIENWPGYVDLMYKIIEKLPPYQQLLGQVQRLNLDDYK